MLVGVFSMQLSSKLMSTQTCTRRRWWKISQRASIRWLNWGSPYMVVHRMSGTGWPPGQWRIWCTVTMFAGWYKYQGYCELVCNGYNNVEKRRVYIMVKFFCCWSFVMLAINAGIKLMNTPKSLFLSLFVPPPPPLHSLSLFPPFPHFPTLLSLLYFLSFLSFLYFLSLLPFPPSLPPSQTPSLTFFYPSFSLYLHPSLPSPPPPSLSSHLLYLPTFLNPSLSLSLHSLTYQWHLSFEEPAGELWPDAGEHLSPTLWGDPWPHLTPQSTQVPQSGQMVAWTSVVLVNYNFN